MFLFSWSNQKVIFGDIFDQTSYQNLTKQKQLGINVSSFYLKKSSKMF